MGAVTLSLERRVHTGFQSASLKTWRLEVCMVSRAPEAVPLHLPERFAHPSRQNPDMPHCIAGRRLPTSRASA
eukprot:1177889-Prorocentrum_minimum.AAC.5